MTERCKIDLQPVAKDARHAHYNDKAYRELFGRLRVAPELPFTRKEIAQESIKYVKGMSISGVQQKLLLTINKQHQLTPISPGGEYILKPSPEEFPHAAENEHACMLSAALLGIEIAQCGLLKFKDSDELAYVTKRFDRLPDGSKQHQEDMAQGFNIPDLGKYEKSYEETGKQILELTRGKKTVLFDFFKRIVHAYLVGNDDMHLKNISVQKSPDNTTHYYDSLTPSYDNLFVEVYQNNADGSLALNMYEEEEEGEVTPHFRKYGFYTGLDFLELAQRFKLGNRAPLKFLRTAVESETGISEIISNSFMPEELQELAKAKVKDRAKAIKIGLPTESP
jgi:serine/threonine-protein kinase HipA